MQNLLNKIVQNKVKAVLIDLDNTLCDTEEYYPYALECCYFKFKNEIKNITFEEFKLMYQDAQKKLKENTNGQASSHSRLIYFQLIFEKYFEKTCIDLAIEYNKLYYQSVFSKTKLYPGVKKFLNELKKMNIRTCVITDQVAELQFNKLQLLKIDKLIDFVVTSEEAGIEKPNPKIFQIALNKLGLKVFEVAMIGDSPTKDMQGASNAGIKHFYLLNHEK